MIRYLYKFFLREYKLNSKKNICTIKSKNLSLKVHRIAFKDDTDSCLRSNILSSPVFPLLGLLPIFAIMQCSLPIFFTYFNVIGLPL